MQGASTETLPSPIAGTTDKCVRVLAVTPFEHDHSYLEHTFHQTNWQIDRARSRTEALACLEDGGYSIVLCEDNLPDSTWREVLDYVQSLPHPPVVIVTSRVMDDPLWAEVLNVGGYDVLMKPFDRREVVRVLSQAWRQWKHGAGGPRIKACGAAS